MLCLRLVNFGRFTAAVGVKLTNSVPRICGVVSCAIDVYLLMFVPNVPSLVNSQTEHECVQTEHECVLSLAVQNDIQFYFHLTIFLSKFITLP